jgi:hypothetical protein
MEKNEDRINERKGIEDAGWRCVMRIISISSKNHRLKSMVSVQKFNIGKFTEKTTVSDETDFNHDKISNKFEIIKPKKINIQGIIGKTHDQLFIIFFLNIEMCR